jgi:hypothetical protein
VTKRLEREFLKLACAWMRCRYQLMTGHMPNRMPEYKLANPVRTMEYAMLGQLDNRSEMSLICREVLQHINEQTSLSVTVTDTPRVLRLGRR